MLPGPSTNGRRLSAEKLNFIFGISFSGWVSAKELAYFLAFFLLFIDGITDLDRNSQSNLLDYNKKDEIPKQNLLSPLILSFSPKA